MSAMNTILKPKYQMALILLVVVFVLSLGPLALPHYIKVMPFLILLSYLSYYFPMFGLAMNVNGIFLFSTYFNWLEVEGGVLFALRLILLFSLSRLHKENALSLSRIRYPDMMIVLASLALMIFGLSISNAFVYGAIKIARFVSFNLFLLVVAVVIKWDRRLFDSFLVQLGMLGAIAGWISLVYVIFNGLDLTQRVSLFAEVNVIWYSRSLGVGLLAVTGLLMLKSTKGSTILLAFSILGMVIGMLLSGSRGPILALVAGVFVALLLKTERKTSTFIWFSVSTLLVASLGIFVLLKFSSGARLLTDPTNLGSDISALHRVIAWIKSFELIAQNPILGIGTGGFLAVGNELFPWLPKNIYSYPHNIFIEIAVENGFLGLGLFLLLLVRNIFLIVPLNQRQNFIRESTVLGLFTYFLINAQFGGDVTMNEGVWFSLGVFSSLAVNLNENELKVGNAPNHDVLDSEAL